MLYASAKTTGARSFHTFILTVNSCKFTFTAPIITAVEDNFIFFLLFRENKS